MTSFYHSSIEASLDTADEILKNQKQSNVLLMDMLDGIDHIGRIEKDKKAKEFYKDKGVIWGTISFLKHHLFDSFINDSFTLTIFFITKLCFFDPKSYLFTCLLLGLWSDWNSLSSISISFNENVLQRSRPKLSLVLNPPSCSCFHNFNDRK